MKNKIIYGLLSVIVLSMIVLSGCRSSSNQTGQTFISNCERSGGRVIPLLSDGYNSVGCLCNDKTTFYNSQFSFSGCENTSLCIDWTPDPSTVCSGNKFTQTSNCGTTRTVDGTLDCYMGIPSSLNEERCITSGGKWEKLCITDFLNMDRDCTYHCNCFLVSTKLSNYTTVSTYLVEGNNVCSKCTSDLECGTDSCQQGSNKCIEIVYDCEEGICKQTELRYDGGKGFTCIENKCRGRV